jgi:hypothetical protein
MDFLQEFLDCPLLCGGEWERLIEMTRLRRKRSVARVVASFSTEPPSLFPFKKIPCRNTEPGPVWHVHYFFVA